MWVRLVWRFRGLSPWLRRRPDVKPGVHASRRDPAGTSGIGIQQGLPPARNDCRSYGTPCIGAHIIDECSTRRGVECAFLARKIRISRSKPCRFRWPRSSSPMMGPTRSSVSTITLSSAAPSSRAEPLACCSTFGASSSGGAASARQSCDHGRVARLGCGARAAHTGAIPITPWSGDLRARPVQRGSPSARRACPSLADAVLRRGGSDCPSSKRWAVGTPVIASDLPAHREIAGDLAIYRDPTDEPG